MRWTASLEFVIKIPEIVMLNLIHKNAFICLYKQAKQKLFICKRETVIYLH